MTKKDNFLTKLRKSMLKKLPGWPLTNYSEQLLKKTLRKQGISRHNLAASEITEFYQQIADQQRDTIQMIANNISQQVMSFKTLFVLFFLKSYFLLLLHF